MLSVEALSASAAVTLIGIVFVWLALDFARLLVGGPLFNFAKFFKREEKEAMDADQESDAGKESEPDVKESPADGDAEKSDAENDDAPSDDSKQEEN